MHDKLDIVFLGLTLSSTWGNGHATTYRALLKALSAQGHRVTFLERDVPWYASNREFEQAPHGTLHFYQDLKELQDRFGNLILNADVVITGSYVPEGIAAGNFVTKTARGLTCFYDIDTPVTLASLATGSCEYLSEDLCRRYQLYLSFTGGPTLKYVEKHLHSPAARALYCSVDPDLYYPKTDRKLDWAVGYLGTYAVDRQPALESLLLEPARALPYRNFIVAGPQYPAGIEWPTNVVRQEHVAASAHVDFYNSQVFTLNLTRQDMVRAGYSPSVRLFEAAACGTPILTDVWPGLDTIFKPGLEIFPVRNSADVTSYLQMPEERRQLVAVAGRVNVLRYHTASVRAHQLTSYVAAVRNVMSRARRNRVFVPAKPGATALA